MLLVEGLTKRFGPLTALDGVGFSVERGQVVGFLGPNGAGKTTTMRAIMRLVQLDAGTVTWDGVPVDAAVRQRFGYMPAERGMYLRMKVLDHLTYYGQFGGLDAADAKRAAESWLERLGLADRAGDSVQSLSSGNQQRVQLALALLSDPELLILDEPFSGLDPLAVEMLSDVLHDAVERGAALLLSSHQLDLVADVCSAVVIVDGGRVVLRGDVAEIRGSSAVRHLDVEFAHPVPWRPADGSAVSADGRRHRVVVESEAQADALLSGARAAGPVLAYSFAPPGLSEVFLEAVGRNTFDSAEPAAPEVVR